MLGVTPEDWFMDDRGAPLAVRGRLTEPRSLAELAASLKDATGRPPLAFPGRTRSIRTVGICSGGAARASGSRPASAWMPGSRASRPRTRGRSHPQLGISFVAGGHYATETFGVRALASVLQRRFGVETTFLDVPNPV